MPNSCACTPSAPVRPLTAAQVKKQFEQIDKDMDEGKRLFHYAIRSKEDDRLIGDARIEWVEWSNGYGVPSRSGFPTLPTGARVAAAMCCVCCCVSPSARSTCITWKWCCPNTMCPPCGFFEKHGFIIEVRRRQAVNRGGRRWDLIQHGHPEARMGGAQ